MQSLLPVPITVSISQCPVSLRVSTLAGRSLMCRLPARRLVEVPHHRFVLILRDLPAGVALAKDVVRLVPAAVVAVAVPAIVTAPAPREEGPPQQAEEQEEPEDDPDPAEPPPRVHRIGPDRRVGVDDEQI